MLRALQVRRVLKESKEPSDRKVLKELPVRKVRSVLPDPWARWVRQDRSDHQAQAELRAKKAKSAARSWTNRSKWISGATRRSGPARPSRTSSCFHTISRCDGK